MRSPRLGFAPGAAPAVVALGIGPVGWVALGIATALPFLRFGSPRGEYQKFDREVYPTLASASRATGLETLTGWFNELVGTDAAGNRKVFGSWEGMGPEWGNLAAAKVMELARDNFLLNFQSTAQNPWVVIGPHQTLGSVVYISFETLQALSDWWQTEEARIIREGPQILEGPEPETPAIEPTYEPIDPGEVSAPPPADPATGQTQIDPPAPPPPYRYPLPRGTTRGWPELIGDILGGIFGAGRRTPSYPGGTYPRAPGAPRGGAGGNGALGLSSDDWLWLGAAGLVVLAATQKKRRKHATRQT